MDRVARSCENIIKRFLCSCLVKNSEELCKQMLLTGISGFNNLSSIHVPSTCMEEDDGVIEDQWEYRVDTMDYTPLGTHHLLVQAEMTVEESSLQLLLSGLQLTVILHTNTIDPDRITYVHASLPQTSQHKMLEHAYKELESIASTDCLTGLYSRCRIESEVRRELKRSRRYNDICSVAFIDIDRFKMLNDNLGHLFGDHILKQFSQMVKDSIRETDYAGRWGGDEFLLLFPNTTVDQAERILRYILESFSRISIVQLCRNYNHEFVNFHRLTIPEGFLQAAEQSLSFSYGAAQYNGDESFHQLFSRIDSRMYSMKHQEHHV